MKFGPDFQGAWVCQEEQCRLTRRLRTGGAALHGGRQPPPLPLEILQELLSAPGRSKGKGLPCPPWLPHGHSLQLALQELGWGPFKIHHQVSSPET